MKAAREGDSLVQHAGQASRPDDSRVSAAGVSSVSAAATEGHSSAHGSRASTLPREQRDGSAGVDAGRAAGTAIVAPMKRSYLMGRPHFAAGIATRAGGPADDRPKSFTGRSQIDLMLKQWHGLMSTMQRHGADVLAAMPDRATPDLAFMGLAGLLIDRSARRAVTDKAVITPTLDGKSRPLQEALTRTIKALGFRVESLEHRFGGAGDFFRCGRGYVFCCGPEAIDDDEASGAKRLISMFTGKAAPWSSDPRLREPLAEMVPGAEVFQFTLVDPRYPRGDMVATSVGEERTVLMVNVKALHEDAQRLILGRKARVSGTVIPVSEQDAAMYATGCIQLPARKPGEKPVIILPDGVSSDLTGRLERAGCACELVNLSEWIKKDRGGPAALVLDLGYLRDDRRSETTEIRDHRAAMRQGLDKEPTAG
ncbi:MAG: hypothetical protein ACKVZJ_02575 [Phycisphaerales bacterium]